MDYKEFFKTQRENCRLPRWEDLPDIELYMDQVLTLISKYLSMFNEVSGAEKLITPSMINNYVKAKLVAAPINKKYPRISECVPAGRQD